MRTYRQPFEVICSDAMAALRETGSSSIDAIVTDPPYHLTSRGGSPRQNNPETPFGRTKVGCEAGFMGKRWDGGDIAHRPELWSELLRVLKPGGHLIAFGGTRTYHRMACAVEDAGFEIRDMISWLYGQGFPKSRNLEGEFEGWGTALKPAHEPCVLARKPLIGTVETNMAIFGVGAINVDAARIPVADADYAKNNSGRRGHAENHNRDGATSFRPTGGTGSDAGRWPANAAFDEDAAALLDMQSGVRTSGKAPATGFVRNSDKHRNTYAAFQGNREEPTVLYGDSGGASRFFFCAKSSKSERNSGGATNTHPTVKPVTLMRWLVKLITPPGGTVLDPFCGSGSTGVAAIQEGVNFIGIDSEPEYVEIAEARISAAQIEFSERSA